MLRDVRSRRTRTESHVVFESRCGLRRASERLIVEAVWR